MNIEEQPVNKNESDTERHNIKVSSFYHFFQVENPIGLQRKFLRLCKLLEIKGTILIGGEGINATISGSDTNIKQFHKECVVLTGIDEITFKESITFSHPFEKLKVKIKPEIVAMGVDNIDVLNNRGKYVKSRNWDEFISRSDVVLIDTRNKYETRLGTFEGAIDPLTNTFREFPKWFDKNKEKFENKKIAMFCTGGIRCEKSTSYIKQTGIDEVYHLEGGILQYLEDNQDNPSSKWKGQCFVFDDRSVLDSSLHATTIYCEICLASISTRELKHVEQGKKNICTKCVEI